MRIFSYLLTIIFNCVISQSNDISNLEVGYLNLELIDGINIHKISFEFDYNNKDISITTINNCLYYELATNLCVALFKYIVQSHLDIITSHQLTKHEITHQHQHFSRLVIIQELLLYSNYNLFLRNFNNNDDDSIRYEKLVLCISHYDESLTWLHATTTPFIIVSKTIYSPTHLLHVPINAGNEVSSYLLYIITYYEILPEYTLFLHGHEHAWHQFYPITYIIKHGLNYQYQYQNINNLLIENSLTNTSMIKLRNVWKKLFQSELGNPPNVYIYIY